MHIVCMGTTEMSNTCDYLYSGKETPGIARRIRFNVR